MRYSNMARTVSGVSPPARAVEHCCDVRLPKLTPGQLRVMTPPTHKGGEEEPGPHMNADDILTHAYKFQRGKSGHGVIPAVAHRRE